MIKILSIKEPQPNLGYQLQHFIGRGSYGEVWKAICPQGKPVALKFLECRSPRAASREIRAQQTIDQLSHPHLITTYQIWADAGSIVIAMELAEGSLADLLEVSIEESNEPLPADLICHYLRQAASALDFLNTRQHTVNQQRVAVRHCDVKPSNLLICDNILKLADFSFLVPTTHDTFQCGKVGTPHFCAPEIFRGTVTDRTDQYSLGITYYQLRTGRLPFSNEEYNGFSKETPRGAPDLSYLTKEEQPIVGRALSAAPQDRWPSCCELIDRLQSALGLAPQ